MKFDPDLGWVMDADEQKTMFEAWKKSAPLHKGGREMSDINIYEAAYDAAEAECKALRAECDRLREALKLARQSIVSGCDTVLAVGVIDKALKGAFS